MKDMDILDKLCLFLGEAAPRKYQTRRVKHGRRRSQASRLKGSQKRKYVKNLKKKKREYARSTAAKNKAKKKRIKYNRTAGAKRAKRMYKPTGKSQRK